MKKKNVSFRRYFKIFSGVKLPWLMFISIVVLTFFSYYLSMSRIYVTGDIVDASGYVDGELLIQYVIPSVLFSLLAMANTILVGVAGEKVNLGLRQKLWRKMMVLPNANYDKDRGEELVSRVTTDCDSASSIYTVVLTSIMLFISIGILLGEMFRADTEMSIYSMLLIPVSVLIGWIYGKARYWIGSRTQGTLSESTAYLVERTRNINLIRTAGTQDAEAVLGNKKFLDQYSVELKTGFLRAAYSSVSRFLPVIGQAIIFLLGAKLVTSGEMSVGDVVVFYSFSSGISQYSSSLISSFGTIRQAVGAMDRVVEILETESEDLNKGEELDVPDTDITVNKVSFAYSDKVVLDGLSCVIPKNKTTAVIGANGSGKTTLFKLLERFYIPEEGSIQFGNRDAQDYSLNSWRQTIGYVPQDNAIMEGTIRSNITFGCKRPITDAELGEVAKAANLTELIATLPDGFDSYVAPGGRNFSGGQRQCIAIARAIVYNPDVLLLDEATSSLDARSERTVAEALHNLMKGRTTVIIAHNLAAIRKADHVIVIKNGKVEASGAPAEIIKSSEMYRKMVMSEKEACAI